MVLPRRPTRFFSERLLLDADLYLPGHRTSDDRRPGVVICSGYTGLKDIHPARFARALCPQGIVCLAFDYRGYGQSEGERGRLVPVDQVRDLRAAVAYLSTLDEVDPDRIGVIGWALGGGIAVAEASEDERVRGVATVNAVGDGERATRYVHTEDSWKRLRGRIEDDRRRRVLVGRSEIVDPFEIVPLDELTRSYVDAELYRVPGFGTGVTLESADALLRFRPELYVDRIAPRPLLIIHAEEDKLNPADESRELHRRTGGHSELVLLEGRGHTEWMYSEHPAFRRVADLLVDFLAGALDFAPLRESA
ncbi:MAG: alpha/beta hydrolase [Actinomycetota bacterium]|nr:alpha/beta hydrolase [Actinomycetota bacterium]